MNESHPHFFLPVRQIENFPTGLGDVPSEPIVIANCGVLSPEELADFDGAKGDKVDPYEDYPIDEDRDTENPEIALQIAKDVREYGNQLFKQGKVEEALQKYQSKVLSILDRGVLIFDLQYLLSTTRIYSVSWCASRTPGIVPTRIEN